MVPDKCIFPALANSTHCLIAHAEARTTSDIAIYDLSSTNCLYQPGALSWMVYADSVNRMLLQPFFYC